MSRVKDFAEETGLDVQEGAEVDFSELKEKMINLRIYTTRCDTLFGVTYMVVSPEHPVIDKYKDED